MSDNPHEQKNFHEILSDLADLAAGEGILLSEALNRIGPHAFCFAAVLLSIPFIQPVPLGPLTQVCGVTFIALGWQMARGRNSPVLPKSAGGLRIHGHFWIAVVGFTKRILSICQRFTRERFSRWVVGKRGRRLVGGLIFTGGALLALPVANLPLNNFFPALMIFFAALAWIERDGLMLILSLAWGGLTVMYFAAVGVALWFFGAKAIDSMMPAAAAAAILFGK
jgi:hypothetical protein